MRQQIKGLPEIQFPHVTDLKGLFTRLAEYRPSPDKPRMHPAFSIVEEGDRPAEGVVKDGVPIGPYCKRDCLNSGYRFYAAYPSLELAIWVQRHMLWIAYDSLSFDIVDHRDDTSLVTIHHSQIIGSRWLAYVRTASIDELLEASHAASL